MTGEITPETHVRMSLNKVAVIIIAIVGVVGSAVASGVGAWAALNGKLVSHVNDDERHLDKDWQKDHGRPVGKFDLDVYKAETNRQLGDIAADAKASRKMIQDATFRPRRRVSQPTTVESP